MSTQSMRLALGLSNLRYRQLQVQDSEPFVG